MKMADPGARSLTDRSSRFTLFTEPVTCLGGTNPNENGVADG